MKREPIPQIWPAAAMDLIGQSATGRPRGGAAHSPALCGSRHGSVDAARIRKSVDLRRAIARFAVDSVVAVDAPIVSACMNLVPQLSTTATPPSADALREVVASPCTTLMVARDTDDGNRIVGMLTLVIFRIPTRVRAWIEDVVVEEPFRRLGVGALLVGTAVETAIGKGAHDIELTSKPSRLAAHALYGRLGFKVRDTSVYRYSIE